MKKNLTLSLIKQRISANKFDTIKPVSEETIRELVEYALQSPSSFNIQHERFVAIRKPEDKERLKNVAFGQQKVADAPVTFIVLGDLDGHKKLPDILSRSVKVGIVDEDTAKAWVDMANGMYENNRQMARDEAIRSASLSAMILMIAAEAKGLVSGPMIGFDPEAVKKEFAIADHYVPAMLIPVGYPTAGNLPRKPRLRVDEVLAFDKGREF
jgi:nitroreductase